MKETRAFVFPLLNNHWCSAFWGFLFYCACPSYFSNLNSLCWKIYAIKNSVNNLHSLVSSYLGYHNKTHTNIIECELKFNIFKIVYSVKIVNIAHHLVHLLCHFLIFFFSWLLSRANTLGKLLVNNRIITLIRRSINATKAVPVYADMNNWLLWTPAHCSHLSGFPRQDLVCLFFIQRETSLRNPLNSNHIILL